MESSPKRYASNFTCSTAQRGVEAKEIEIANARLDVNNISSSSQLGAECYRGDCDECVPVDDTASFLQVVIEKHRRKQKCAAVAVQTCARLPSASSPVEIQCGAQGAACGACGACGGGDGSLVWAAPLLVSRADPPYCARCGDAAWPEEKRSRRESAAAQHAEHDVRPLVAGEGQKPKWKFFQDFYSNNLCDDGPERVEVYRFEHGSGEYLAARGGARVSRCEAAARRGARGAAAALTRVLAAPRALLALPVALVLHVHRCSLEAAREAATGCALAASDVVLKPALAVTFNALVQPVLVFVGNVFRAVRAALRPAALALGDAVEPAARLLAAVRLVHVHVAPARAACQCARATHTQT